MDQFETLPMELSPAAHEFQQDPPLEVPADSQPPKKFADMVCQEPTLSMTGNEVPTGGGHVATPVSTPPLDAVSGGAKETVEVVEVEDEKDDPKNKIPPEDLFHAEAEMTRKDQMKEKLAIQNQRKRKLTAQPEDVEEEPTSKEKAEAKKQKTKEQAAAKAEAKKQKTKEKAEKKAAAKKQKTKEKAEKKKKIAMAKKEKKEAEKKKRKGKNKRRKLQLRRRPRAKAEREMALMMFRKPLIQFNKLKKNKFHLLTQCLLPNLDLTRSNLKNLTRPRLGRRLLLAATDHLGMGQLLALMHARGSLTAASRINSIILLCLRPGFPLIPLKVKLETLENMFVYGLFQSTLPLLSFYHLAPLRFYLLQVVWWNFCVSKQKENNDIPDLVAFYDGLVASFLLELEKVKSYLYKRNLSSRFCLFPQIVWTWE